LGCTPGAAAAVFDARGNEQPVQRGATGGEQALTHVGIEPVVVGLVVGEPVGQGGLAMVAEEFDPFGDPLGFEFAAGAGAAPAHLGQHFLTCAWLANFSEDFSGTLPLNSYSSLDSTQRIATQLGTQGSGQCRSVC
jgi:hypothetical protein